MRAYFFGKSASTAWNRKKLEEKYKNYKHYNADIRDQKALEDIFKTHRFDLIIHTAAQPSHDWAAKEPLTDFSINASATLLLLEQYRQHCPQAVFIFTSTNKVYGDSPNRLPLVEQKTRWELPKDNRYFKGIDESMSIDNTLHSVFGASKVAADVMVQEYGKYFGLLTGTFRGGCLTGSSHSGAQLHGFLAYLVQCVVAGKPYTIFGYKGKQVRDNIHAFDVINAFYRFYQKPRPGEVYNIGGGRYSNVSILEAISKIETKTGIKAKTVYKEQNRIGDHIWYVADLTKLMVHFRGWKISYDTDKILDELIANVHV
ncbi:MAG: hypothetical protein ACD_36C00075G0002 [uncultured bacterium]|nr:MAG: hypothetical protein ACD_36C00075G0002 [uncultured bacterium]